MIGGINRKALVIGVLTGRLSMIETQHTAFIIMKLHTDAICPLYIIGIILDSTLTSISTFKSYLFDYEYVKSLSL